MTNNVIGVNVCRSFYLPDGEREMKIVRFTSVNGKILLLVSRSIDLV